MSPPDKPKSPNGTLLSPPDDRLDPSGPLLSPPKTGLPLVSVVIPVKDRLKELRQCLEALDANPYEKREIIVVDDASAVPLKQETLGVACRIIRFDEQQGPAVARNTGAREAAGSVIVFLDSDCLLNPDALERIGRHMTAHPETAAVNGIYVTPPNTENTPSRFAALEMNYCFFNPPPTVFTAVCAVRKEVFLTSGGFDESLSTPFADDVLFGWHLKELGYRTDFDYDLRALHLKRYTFMSYLQNSFEHHAVITAMYLKQLLRPDSMESGSGSSSNIAPPLVSSRRPLNLAIFSAVVLWMVVEILCSLCGCRHKPPRFVPWLLLGALVANNARLCAYLAREMGPVAALEAVPVLLADIVISSAGVAAGLLRAVDMEEPR